MMWKRSIISRFLILLTVLNLCSAWEPDFILRVSNTTLHSDCQPRQSIVINGTSPGPLLRFKEGQHYWIRVFNDIPDQNTTIHWHGFSQYMSPFSDGTPQASGWPIPPGHFYDYEFQLEKGFYGTYWYHSHVGMQRLTAQGPIIIDQVYGNDSPVKYDEDIVMMLGDYYHAEDSTIYNGLVNDTLFAWLGEPQNLLINGNSAGKCNSSVLKPGQQCTTSCGVNQQFVKPNTRYRVRMIGATVLSYIGLALEGHQMTLFEADGTYLEPVNVTSVEIASGQRYSVLITTPSKPSKSDFYWNLETMWRPTRVYGAGIWTYNSTKAKSPIFTTTYSGNALPGDYNSSTPIPSETFGWISDSFVPYSKSSYPPSDNEVTKKIYLNGIQMTTGPMNKGFRWFVNDELNNGTKPDVPLLLQYYTKDPANRSPNYTLANMNGGYDPTTNAYPVKMGEILDIIIQNRAGETSGMAEGHPWHSHGAKYWDMGNGVGNFSYQALAASRSASKGQPFERDTSVVYPSPGASYANQTTDKEGYTGWRLFRIKVTDPGLWLVHCHLAPHQIMGMQAVFLYGMEDLPAIPNSLLNEYKTFGGGAFGQQTYDYDGTSPASANYIPRSFFEVMEAEKREEARGIIDNHNEDN